MPTPNAFIIGAPKCGTTSLAAYLGQHPSIYMSPIKEPGFFAPEVAAMDPAIIQDWDAYLRLFVGARGERVIAEASVAYLSSVNAPAGLAARVPGARLIAVLRDPADRLFAHYAAARAAGVADDSFGAWIDRQRALEDARDPVIGPIWAGRYGAHLERYRRHFPASQLRLIWFDDLARDAASVVRETLAFLGVDPAAPIDTSIRLNVTTVPRWPWMGRVGRAFRVPFRLKPSAGDRALAIAIYRDDIRALESILDREMRHWLR